MAGHRRTTGPGSEYATRPGERVGHFTGIYVGFVKDNRDVQKMGRLKIWIPELGGDPHDEVSWKTCSYAAPFAGATPVKFVEKDLKEYTDTQTSYGFWMIPPDVDAQVLVAFANGNSTRGFWFASIYDNFMNQMVPGVAASESAQHYGPETTTDSELLPTAEYDKYAGTSRPPVKPDREKKPIHQYAAAALRDQGLVYDEVRGLSDSSARREAPSKVFGISTPGPLVPPSEGGREGKPYEAARSKTNDETLPITRKGGHQFIMDDHEDHEHIKLRTRSGSEIILDETNGMVYLTNADGTAWVELSKSGHVDVYAAKSLSVRGELDINLHADRDINIEAGRNVNIKAAQTYPDTSGFVTGFVDAFLGAVASDELDALGSDFIDVATQRMTELAVSKEGLLVQLKQLDKLGELGETGIDTINTIASDFKEILTDFSDKADPATFGSLLNDMVSSEAGSVFSENAIGDMISAASSKLPIAEVNELISLAKTASSFVLPRPTLVDLLGVVPGVDAYGEVIGTLADIGGLPGMDTIGGLVGIDLSSLGGLIGIDGLLTFAGLSDLGAVGDLGAFSDLVKMSNFSDVAGLIVPGGAISAVTGMDAIGGITGLAGLVTDAAIEAGISTTGTGTGGNINIEALADLNSTIRKNIYLTSVAGSINENIFGYKKETYGSNVEAVIGGNEIATVGGNFDSFVMGNKKETIVGSREVVVNANERKTHGGNIDITSILGSKKETYIVGTVGVSALNYDLSITGNLGIIGALTAVSNITTLADVSTASHSLNSLYLHTHAGVTTGGGVTAPVVSAPATPIPAVGPIALPAFQADPAEEALLSTPIPTYDKNNVLLTLVKDGNKEYCLSYDTETIKSISRRFITHEPCVEHENTGKVEEKDATFSSNLQYRNLD